MEDAADTNSIPSQDDRSVRNVLLAHAAADFMRGAASCIATIFPFVARRHFDAAYWEVWILTVSVPVSQFFTIYWHRVFRNISTRSYIATVGLTMALPLLLMSRLSSLDGMIALWIIATFGGAGGGAALSPLNASVLRNRYPQAIRGRAFGVIGTFMFLGVITGGYIVGELSRHDYTMYRYYLPGAAVLLAAAMLIYVRIAPARSRVGGWPEAFRGWWKPLTESTELLRSDHNFRSYEAAYMSYGIGWMICTALLPFIGNDRLRLTDDDFSNATIVTQQAVMMLLLFPAGRIADKIGPVRLVTTSFLWLSVYPVLLLVAWSGASLTAATIAYGIGMVGVHLAWTLGPVQFAPSPEQAPQYLAVHGTLVGVRGVVFQGLGVGLYAVTGSVTAALAIASLGFLYASWQMRKLGKRLALKPIEVAAPPTLVTR